MTRERRHGRLYAHDIPTWIYVRAAAIDAALIVGALLLAGRWGRGFWPVLVGSLLVVAVGIELWALSTGRWSYTDTMPTVGPIGVSPLVQLPLTARSPRWSPGGRLTFQRPESQAYVADPTWVSRVRSAPGDAGPAVALAATNRCGVHVVSARS